MNNTQFSIAVHVMAGLGYRGEDVQSRGLAKSVNTCPSFVRRVLAKLSKAGLIRTTTGKTGGCALARPPKQITLLEIYRAVEPPKVFSIHEHPKQKSCAVSCGIKDAMEHVLESAQKSMEARLGEITLGQILKRLKP